MRFTKFRKSAKCLLAAAAFLVALPAGAQVFIPSGGFYTISQGLGNAAGATVSSVAASGDGTVLASSVTGSPVTTSGTLAFSLATACAQCVLANATGSTAVPTYRLITVAMLPSMASAQLAAIVSDETGSGLAVFATSPTFTTSTILAGANGQTLTQGVNRESLTLATGATTTLTSGNLAPANSRILAITYRVTTTITTAINFTVKVTGGNAFASIGTATTSQTGMTATTTGRLVPAAYPDQYNTSATTLTVTTNANPGAGVIELSVFYETYVAPTS